MKMKKYDDITVKYLKTHKKRTILTILGIIMSLSLIAGVGFMWYSVQEALVQDTKVYNGDYEVIFLDVNKDAVEKLLNHSEVCKLAVNRFKGTYKSDDVKSKKDIYLSEYSVNAYNEVFTRNMIEGRLPENNGEIILETRAKKGLNKNIGDKVSFTTKEKNEENKRAEKEEFTITGFYEPKFSDSNSYTGETIISKFNEGEKYIVSFSLKAKKGKAKIGNKLAKELGVDGNHIDFNNELLAFKGDLPNEAVNTSMKIVVAIVLAIIILATVALIYNAINISVMERIGQFGLLRAVGATPKQIRGIVFKEALIMCLLSVPFGVVFGYLGVYVTFKLIGSVPFVSTGVFNINFYPKVILLTIILGVITIFIASFGPCRKASKVSPIEAIRDNGNIVKENIKRRDTKFISKLLGIEGAVAYKNIRRNNKRFLVILFSLVISLVMFVVFTTANNRRESDVGNMFRANKFSAFVKSNDSGFEKSFIDDVNNIGGIDKAFKASYKPVPIPVKSDVINEEFSKFYNGKENKKLEGTEYNILNNGYISCYDDASLERLKGKISDKENKFAEVNENEVIIVNKSEATDKNGKKYKLNVTNYKVGDTIKIPKNIAKGKADSRIENIQNSIKNNDFYEFKVVSLIEEDTISDFIVNIGGMQLIFSEKGYEKLVPEFKYDTMCINFKNKEISKETSAKLEEKASEAGYNYFDCDKAKEGVDKLNFQVKVFIYGFITIVTLIGVVNVINTISVNILLRRKEFGALMSIGMDKSQLNKMIIYEGVLHGVIASIIGGIISVLLLKAMFKGVSVGFEINTAIDIKYFIVGFAGIILVTLIASLIPLRKLKKLSLVESIRCEE